MDGAPDIANKAQMRRNREIRRDSSYTLVARTQFAGLQTVGRTSILETA
jgi:hypothetical protein